MKYYKTVINGYIYAVSKNPIGIEISKEEYHNIICIMKKKPIKEGYRHKLRDVDLIWEEYEFNVHEYEETEEKDEVIE